MTKFNPNPNKKPKNAKEAAKLEEAARKVHSANIRSAEYQAMQEKIQTPFGKAFKTGANIDKRKELEKGKRKHKGKGWE